MAQTVVAFEEIEPFAGDTIETVHYVTCDYCFESIVQDIWDGKPWRTLYRVQDGSELTVCENCIPNHLEEQP